MSKEAEIKPEESGYIYFARGDGFIKIGHALNPHNRLKRIPYDVLVPNQSKLEGIGYVAATLREEIDLHKQLARYRITGTRECYAEGVLEDQIITGMQMLKFQDAPFYEAPSGEMFPCPYCGGNIPAEDIASEGARLMSGDRKTFGGGRPPRKGVPRCPCGRMTLKRAETRGREGRGKDGKEKHLPSCPFHFPAA